MPPATRPLARTPGHARARLPLIARRSRAPATLFVRFVPRQPVNQTQRAAHLDHMRTTSIPSNHGTFTSHLHIKA
jgi:hypothetical protein